MPTYNYYCDKCDMNFSYFQKMSETHLTTCEKCGGKIKRVITGGSGLIFKGSGFKDGNKTDSETEKGDAGSTEESKTEKKETKSSKSEKKSTSKKVVKSDE